MKPATLAHLFVAGTLLLGSTGVAVAQSVTATKIDGDSSTPEMDPILSQSTFSAVGAASAGTNINGPSVIRVPDWIPASERVHPDANYYMYFANHNGDSIRMAWAESVTGNWSLFNTGFSPSRAYGTGTGIGPGGNNGTQTPGSGVIDLNLDDYLDSNLDDGAARIHIDGPAAARYQIRDEIASPDVFVDDVNQRIVMYFHADSWGTNRDQNATDSDGRSLPGQHTYVTTSKYGLNFNHADQADAADPANSGIRESLLGQFYFRAFDVQGEANGQQVNQSFAFSNRGFLYKAPTFTSAGEDATLANGDEPGGLWNPTHHNGAWWDLIAQDDNPLHGIRISPDTAARTRDQGGDDFRSVGEFTNDETPRHFAIYHDAAKDADTIYVFYSSRGDRPESIVLARFSLHGLTAEERLDPAHWSLVDDTEELILTPEYAWEGANRPLAYSQNGAQSNVNQLRDPYIFADDDGEVYLFYTGAGESAIGVAHLSIIPEPATATLLLVGGALLLRRSPRRRRLQAAVMTG